MEPTMSQLWTPSDDLLQRDPIALQKITTPFEAPELEENGIALFDIEDDDANEAAACLVLASLEHDDVAGDEPGESSDDDDLDDPDDDEDVTPDV
jgi:hypothetical protein